MHDEHPEQIQKNNLIEQIVVSSFKINDENIEGTNTLQFLAGVVTKSVQL